MLQYLLCLTNLKAHHFSCFHFIFAKFDYQINPFVFEYFVAALNSSPIPTPTSYLLFSSITIFNFTITKITITITNFTITIFNAGYFPTQN